MPQASSLEVAGRIDDWWSTAKRDILADPFGQMARAGLFQIGLPGAGAALDTYRAIALAKQAIAAKTGLLGLASAFAARQMTARFFVAGFADAGQRATWLPRIAIGQVCAAIAISEPEVGAHPKHLRTTADSSGAGFVVRGRKAWVTNGPIADVFLVLAVTAIEDERKRYGLFLIPRETAGLVVKPMQTLDALAPASHCELEFDGCHVSATALVGQVADAYPVMALPFRCRGHRRDGQHFGTAELAARKVCRGHRAQRRECPAARPHRGSGVPRARGEPARGGSARRRRAGCSCADDWRSAAGARHRR